MRRLKEEAARRGSTPSELVAEALRRMLEDRREGSAVAELPTFRGGEAFIDVSDREALFRAMEGAWLFLVDTNILVYGANQDVAQHRRCHELLER